ncbi:hypothetical protein [Streptomyces sp. NPDC017988]|uniref:hypothetical protein n=1 Tax=Streptomyces sp. NPDC017988 TaxID=3365025 RepID=UPI0037A4B02D
MRRSTWRPYWNELYYPLVPAQSSTGAPGNVKYEWICYKPTFRPDGIGKDGLVLYEIHTTPLPQGAPLEVLKRIARRLRELENQHQLVLLPAMQQYWDENTADSRELKKWLAIGLGRGGGRAVGERRPVRPERGEGPRLLRTGAGGHAAAAVRRPRPRPRGKPLTRRRRDPGVTGHLFLCDASSGAPGAGL